MSQSAKGLSQIPGAKRVWIMRILPYSSKAAIEAPGLYYVMHSKKQLGSGNVFHFAPGAARARYIFYQTHSREQAKEHL
jgi:hypothetical protein